MKTTIQKIRNRSYNITQENNLLLQPDIVILDERHLQEIEKLEWISVDERLPDCSNDVIVIMQHEDDTAVIQIGFFYNDLWILDRAPAGWGVVYWRPMLALPDLEDEN